MKKRIITVPKDKATEKELNYNEAKKEELIELYLNDDEFEVLFKAGIFKLINQVAKASIDDYEDTAISGQENFLHVIKSLAFKKDSSDKDINRLIREIIVLFKEASNRDTGVYFYF